MASGREDDAAPAASTSSSPDNNNNNNTKYKLSRELVGHEGEVLALAIFKNGSIVSASKDRTARLWTGHDRNYAESVVMTGHSDVACSVCVIDPTDKNPTGFIATGGYDKRICIYYPGEENPIHTLQAHEGVVCHLRTSVFETESFFSSSTDNTGKLWDLYDLKKPMAVYTGHAANSTVWCICDLGNGLVVTGASDKVVLIHERRGNVLHRLVGHSSCVTDITAISMVDFLTCGNDRDIILWNALNGAYIERYAGHTDSVNGITAIDEGKLCASCGKDQTVRIWKMGKVKQIIVVPSETVWDVKLLPNRDVICSASDNIIRIFTTDSSRLADNATMQSHVGKVSKIIEKLKEQNKLPLKNDNRKIIPLEKELNEPGKKDGDTVIVRRLGKVKVYRWSQVNYQWYLVGDVLEDKTGLSKKPVYNGIEYDYVFSVDIMKNAPLLKLPYNKGEDPYQAAQRFLEENDLDPTYLNQVANFIMTNVQLKPIINDELNYQHPFAANKYITNSWSNDASNTSDSSVTKSYIPQTNYLNIEQGNVMLIQDKLLEFNEKLTKENKSAVPQDKVESLINLVKPNENSSSNRDEIDIMMSLLNWPDDVIYPVLDIARLAVLQKNVNTIFCENGVFNVLKRHLQTDSPAANQMLTFRLFVNLFSHDIGTNFCLQSKDEVLEAIAGLSNFKNKHIEIAVSTYILNMTIAVNKAFDVVGKEKILNVTLKIFEFFNENEAIFRALVGIGTLIAETKNDEIRKNFVKKIKNCKAIIMALLRFVDESSACTAKVPIKIHHVSKEVVKLIR